VLLHRDLHPQNVILTADGPRIIDWEGAARGPAAADIAMTWVIVGFSAVPGGVLTAAKIRPMQALFTRSFLRAAGPVDRSWLAVAVRHRLADPRLLPPERVRLERLRIG
jgi:Ser/Thr protein kinase RdoA (MazF antagonist)